MASRARTQLACEQASIRDLMARFILASQVRRECRDAEWNLADAACDRAETALHTALMDATGLTRSELGKLGGLI